MSLSVSKHQESDVFVPCPIEWNDESDPLYGTIDRMTVSMCTVDVQSDN